MSNSWTTWRRRSLTRLSRSRATLSRRVRQYVSCMEQKRELSKEIGVDQQRVADIAVSLDNFEQLQSVYASGHSATGSHRGSRIPAQQWTPTWTVLSAARRRTSRFTITGLVEIKPCTRRCRGRDSEDPSTSKRADEHDGGHRGGAQRDRRAASRKSGQAPDGGEGAERRVA